MNKKTKILLLIPPSFLFPMGAAYVAATLENAGYDYDIYGFFYDNRAWFKRNRVGADGRGKGEAVRHISMGMSLESLFEVIAREKYDYILAGGLVGFFRWFYGILPQIKGYDPQCKIIMGGGITKDLPETVLFEKLEVDFILKGEAETNLIELMTVLSTGTSRANDLKKVHGLCWKDSVPAIRKNAPVRFDLEKTNILPAWDAFPIDEYISLSDTLLRFNKTFFPVLAGRGCPNVCAFCSPSVGRFAPRSVDSVISEMIHWMGKYNFDFFFIYSEIAFDDESYTQEFCRKYKKKIKKPWVGQLRTDVNFSVETYRLMKETGCMFISMGFESASDRVLKIMRKRTTFGDHMRNLSQAKDSGLNVFGNFMFGHETETAAEIKETFDFLNQHDLISGPSNGLASIIVYPGTGYYRNAEKKGLVADSFKYLLSYSMKAGISYVDIREKDDASKLNVSALSDDDFYNVVCTENIKHRRLYSKRHAAVIAERAFELGSEPGFVFKGKCPTCGNPITFEPGSYHNPLNITKLCDRCYYNVSVDIYQFDELKSYAEHLRVSIKESNKMVVLGSWIMDLIFSGALSIPYKKIIAWVDPENPEVSNRKYFYHLPQLSLAALKAHRYDAIVALRPRCLSTPQIMEGHGLDPDAKIIHLIPDAFNPVISKTLTGKTVAVVGESHSMKRVGKFLAVDKSVAKMKHYSNIQEICDADVKYDLIVLDPEEFHVDRHEFAQRSRYLINEILHAEFLLDGGYYVKR
jgi:radical SAM superfamily enzyme YgiQ (UPF0313 family)